MREKDQGSTCRISYFLPPPFYFVESVGRTNFFLLQIKEAKFEMNQNLTYII